MEREGGVSSISDNSICPSLHEQIATNKSIMTLDLSISVIFHISWIVYVE